MCMAKNLKVNIDSEEFRNSFRPHMPPSRASTEEPIQKRQRGGFGVQTDISINGGTFDQITILLNGVNISNPQTGHNASDFPVALADIDHIEVLEGAASRLFGTSAFNGAINIVTKKAKSE